MVLGRGEAGGRVKGVGWRAGQEVGWPREGREAWMWPLGYIQVSIPWPTWPQFRLCLDLHPYIGGTDLSSA